MYKQFSLYMRGGLGDSGYLNFPSEIRAFGDGKVPYQELATGIDTQGKKLVAAATPTPTPPTTPTTTPTTGAAAATTTAPVTTGSSV